MKKMQLTMAPKRPAKAPMPKKIQMAKGMGPGQKKAMSKVCPECGRSM